MAEKQVVAKSSVASGVKGAEYQNSVLGGLPPKKSVEEIEKVNRPSGK